MRELKVKLQRREQDKIEEFITSYVNEGCYHFFNAQHLYLQLTPKERCYFEFLCEKMDHLNRIEIKPTLREEFIIHFKTFTSQKPPTLRTVPSFEKKFCRLNLLLKVKNHGKLHFVNPKYVAKKKETDRKKALQMLGDHALCGEVDYEAIIDRPLDKLLEEARKK